MVRTIRDVETEAFSAAMRQELRRRLDALHAAPPDALEAFSGFEGLLAALAAVGLPWLLWRLLT